MDHPYCSAGVNSNHDDADHSDSQSDEFTMFTDEDDQSSDTSTESAHSTAYCQVCDLINSGNLSTAREIVEITGSNSVKSNCRALYNMIQCFQHHLKSMEKNHNICKADLWKIPEIRHSKTRLEYLELFRLLLRCGIDPNMTVGRETTLMAAVRTQDQGFIALLLQHGADPNKLDGHHGNGEMNAFALAIIINDVSICEQFLHYGARINDACCGSMTPIQLSVNKNSEISDLLLQSGADSQQVVQMTSPNDVSFSDSPLVQAAKSRNVYLASVLLEHGENVNQLVGENSETLLHLAVKQADLEMVEILIQNGANLNHVSNRGHSPLSLSLLLEGDEGIRIAKLLLDSGCSRHTETVISLFHKSYAPIFVACFRGHQSIVDILLEDSDTQETPTGDSTTEPDQTLPQTKIAKSKSITLNLKNPSVDDCISADGCTPLLMAALGGHYDLVQHLLDLGADANESCCHGNLVHAAVMSCSDSSVEMLKMAVNLGCSVNLANEQGNAPLHLAARMNCSEVCLFLVEQGALLNREDRFGETALSASVYFGCCNNSEILVQHGADLDLVDTSGTTALYWAIFNNRKSTLKLLLSAGAKFSPQQLSKYPRNLKIWRDTELMTFIRNHVCEPRSLLDLSVFQIRRTLGEITHGRSIIENLDLLPVPTKVKDKLSLRSHVME